MTPFSFSVNVSLWNISYQWNHKLRYVVTSLRHFCCSGQHVQELLAVER